MNWKSKVGVGAGIVILLGILLLIIKYQYDTITRLTAIEKSVVAQKTLSDGTTRSESSYVTKEDLERFAKDNGTNLNDIKEDLKRLDAKVQGVQVVRVITTGYQGTDIGSTGQTSNTTPVVIDPANPDPFGYLSNRQTLRLTEPFGDVSVPFGEVGFSSWKDRPWDLTILPRQYKVTNVLGTDEDGRHYVYNRFAIEVDGKTHDIKIIEAKFVEEFNKTRFRFNPRLYAGFDGGVYFTQPSGAFNPNIQLALFSHGRTKPDPNWTFLGIGTGYEVVQDKFNFVLTPVSYNIGHHLPFVNNIFLGPTISADFYSNVALMVGMHFGL